MSRRALLTVSVVFVAARLLLVLSAADRIHAPDWAEAKHSILGDRWIEDGPPSLSEVLDFTRDPRNAAHGGFLAVSALYASLTVPLGHADSFPALKLIALLFATLGFLAWTGVAGRLAGPLGGGLAALLLLFPPPVFLAGSLITWGSHSEAAALLGLAALALVSGLGASTRGALLLGLALGATATMSILYLPIVAILLLAWLLSGEAQDSEAGGLHRRRAAWLIAGAAMPLVAGWLLTGGMDASVTEEAGNTPIRLLSRGLASAALIPATLPNLLPLPAWGSELLGSELRRPTRLLLDGVLLGFLLVAWWQILRGARSLPELRGRILALLLVVPVGHLLLLLCFGPRRPSVEMRYLLPLWPILLVSLAVAVGWAWQQGGEQRGRWRTALLGAGLALWLLPGLQVQGQLFEASRIGSPTGEASGFFAYRATLYVDHDVGNVSYDTAAGVNDFLARRGADIRGFNLVPRLPASQDLLREKPPAVLDASRILDRVQKDRATQPQAGPERARIYQNIGWALAVFAPDRPGLWLGLLSRLGNDRKHAAAGLGMALSIQGEPGCGRIQGANRDDRPAMIQAATRLSPDFRERCALRIAPSSTHLPTAQPAGKQGEQQEEP